MEAKEKAILRWLMSENQSQFCIPVFQRNYSWSEKQCRKLFDDIVDLIKNPEWTHFIWSFVYKLNRLVNTQYIQFSLIDGQQRLTSLTLILKALYDYYWELWDAYKNKKEEIWEFYLYNKFSSDNSLRLRLKPNKEDDNNFNLLMDNKIEEMNKDSLIYINYKFFLKSIKEWDFSVDDFYNALARLEWVAITLDEHDNAQLIFESLNSTWLDLTDVDLIRNYLLMNCNHNEQERLYTDYWINLEIILKDSFTDFVRDYITLKNWIVVQNWKWKVYASFRKFYIYNYVDKHIPLENFLKERIDYAKAYSLLLRPNEKKDPKYKLYNALNDTIEINFKTTFPFLLWILHDYNLNYIDSEETVVKILRLIESYWLRRSICSVQWWALSQAMWSMYKELTDTYKDEFYSDTYDKVAKKMISIRTNAYFPADWQFKDEFISRSMYSSPLKKYILCKLEKSFMPKEIINEDNLTIEHIMPQTLNEAWKKYLDMSNVEEFHEQYKNRIWNLTLTAINSELWQKLYDEKKNDSKFSIIALNHYFSNVKTWNKEEIEKRWIMLFEIAKKIWPFPNVAPDEKFANESYDILNDDEDADSFTSTLPIKFKLDDQNEVRVATWSALLQKVCQYLHNANKELFISVLSKEWYVWSAKPRITKDEKWLRSKISIWDWWFMEAWTTTARKIELLRMLFKDMWYDSSTLTVFVVPN